MSDALGARIERLRVLRDGELQRRKLLRNRLALCDNRLAVLDALLGGVEREAARRDAAERDPAEVAL